MLQHAYIRQKFELNFEHEKRHRQATSIVKYIAEMMIGDDEEMQMCIESYGTILWLQNG